MAQAVLRLELAPGLVDQRADLRCARGRDREPLRIEVQIEADQRALCRYSISRLACPAAAVLTAPRIPTSPGLKPSYRTIVKVRRSGLEDAPVAALVAITMTV